MRMLRCSQALSSHIKLMNLKLMKNGVEAGEFYHMNYIIGKEDITTCGYNQLYIRV